jgi:single-strand DNA-binding protein
MFTKLVRIGRDTELRTTTGGKQVASVTAVYDIGFGDNKKGQWIEGALWENRAVALAPYLQKGQQAVITYDDVEVEVYEHNGEHKGKLKARIVDVALCGPKREGQQAAPVNTQTADSGEDFGDEIPFS